MGRVFNGHLRPKINQKLKPSEAMAYLGLGVIERALLDYGGLDFEGGKNARIAAYYDTVKFFDCYQDTIWCDISGLHPDALERLRKKLDQKRIEMT